MQSEVILKIFRRILKNRRIEMERGRLPLLARPFASSSSASPHLGLLRRNLSVASKGADSEYSEKESVLKAVKGQSSEHPTHAHHSRTQSTAMAPRQRKTSGNKSSKAILQDMMQENDLSYLQLSEVIEVLDRVRVEDPSSRCDQSRPLRSFLQRWLVYLSQHSTSNKIDNFQLLKMMSVFGQLNFHYPQVGVWERAHLLQLLRRIDKTVITSSFGNYCIYFNTLQSLKVPWTKFRSEEKRDMLSWMTLFGSPLQLPLADLLVFVEAMENLSISFSSRHHVSTYYLQILNRVLKELPQQSDSKTPVFCNVFSQWKSLNVNNDSLSKSELEVFLIGFHREWMWIDPQKRSRIIFSLGELSVDSQTIPPNIQQTMMIGLSESIEKAPDNRIIYILTGLVRMNWKWNTMSAEFQDALFRRLKKFFLQSEKSFSSSLLPKTVGNHLEQLDPSRQKLYVSMLPRVLMLLAELGINQQHLQLQNAEIFLDAVRVTLLRQMNFLEVVSTLKALATVQCRWELLPSGLQSSLLTAINEHFEGFDDVGIATVLHSLQKIGSRWEDMPISLQRNLLNRFHSTFSSTKANEKSLSFALNAFVAMGYEWKEDCNIQKLVLEKLHTKTAVAPHIATLIIALGKGKMRWDSLPDNSRATLIAKMERLLRDHAVDPKRVRAIFYGLVHLGAHKYNLPKSFQQVLESGVRSIVGIDQPSQYCANILSALCSMQYAWRDLETSTQQSFIRMISGSSTGFAVQELVNTMYSVAVMTHSGVDWKKDYFVPLQTSLLRRCYDLSEEEAMRLPIHVTQLAIYCEWLETLPKLYVDSLLAACGRKELPFFPATEQPQSSPLHLTFSADLRVRWKELAENESSSYIARSRMRSVQFIDEYQGLRRKVCPLDIAVVCDEGEGRRKILLFLEIDCDINHPKFRSVDGALHRDQSNRLRNQLYQHHYPDTSIWSFRNLQDNYHEQLHHVMQRVKQLILNLP